MKISFFFLLPLMTLPTLLSAGGIEGKVTGEIPGGKPVPLAYATVYISEIQSGSSTNSNGDYKIDLAPGTYHVRFQYLGYQSVDKTVTIGNDYIPLNIQMQSIAYELEETVISDDREDPSYTVMRKAIAKAEYHRLQLDSYSAKVYVKGSGRVKDVPFFLQKKMQKEGLDSNMAFNTESIIEVEFKRPNNYNQNVISMRSSGFMNENSPINFVMGSFYNDNINGAVSPLSQSAFSFYRFDLIRTFVDKGNTINKIKVVPKSDGENVFKGFIYILEDQWSIYSLELETIQMGLKTEINQSYAEIRENIWMPINYQFNVSGKVFGFEFQFDYLTTVSDYELNINEDLADFILIDEIVQQDFENDIDKSEIKKGEVKIGDVEDKKLSRRNLMKLMEQYEKEQYQQRKKEGTEDIIYSKNTEVDSMAQKRDSAYWASVRPVPLTDYEKKANQVLDSVKKAEAAEKKKDSIKNNDGFHVQDIVFGEEYKLNKRDRLAIGIPLELSLFNTVDGFHLGYGVEYTNEFGKNKAIILSPEAKYNFKRESFNGQMEMSYTSEDSNLNSFSIAASAGRMESQFNPEEPISPYVNLLTTFLLERNYMKIYEKDFLNLSLNKTFKKKFEISLSAEYSNRRSLRNHSHATLVDIKDREYTPNAPSSLEEPNTNFFEHYAFTSSVELEYRPWQKYKKINNLLMEIPYSSPKFMLGYYSGKSILGSDLDFDRVEIGMEHSFELPAERYIDVEFNAGKFFNNSNMHFPDYRHLMGNESPLVLGEPVGNFRLLDYYKLSTNDEYASAFVHYNFRKLLLTQILPLRMLGLKENIFVNYLYTPFSENYTEIGYGLDNIFRFLRVEAVTNFRSGEFSTFGIRIGVATGLIGNN